MKTKEIWKGFGCLAAVVLSTGCLASCDADVWSLSDDNKGVYKATLQEPIATYLDSQEDFSEWVKVLNYTDYYGTLNQGSQVAFTHIAPNNAAMSRFYSDCGVAGIEDLGMEYAQALVKHHTIDTDSIKFIEKFNSATVQYITVENVFEERMTVAIDPASVGFLLNEKIHFSSDYVAAANGFIYEADGVSTPLVETVTDRVNADPAYSIMAGALRATGYDVVLNTLADTVIEMGRPIITRYEYTFLTVSDESFAKAGITDLEGLKQKLADRYQDQAPGDAGVGADSLLKQYVQYHLLEGSYSSMELSSMIGSDTVRIWSTCAPNQILTMTQHIAKIDTVTLDAELQETSGVEYRVDTFYTVSINEADVPTYFGTTRNDQAVVNIAARNGKVHEVTTWLPVYEPKPAVVVWDLADNAKIRAKAGLLYQPADPVSSEDKILIADCFEELEVGSSGTINSNYYSATYVTCKSNLKKCLNYDRVVFNLGYQGYVTMKTPTLVRGKYKVTISMAYLTEQLFIRTSNGSKGGMMKISFDGNAPIISSPYTTITKSTAGVYEATLYDEIEFTETSSHLLKFVVMDPAASTNSKFSLQFDAITFTPIE